MPASAATARGYGGYGYRGGYGRGIGLVWPASAFGLAAGSLYGGYGGYGYGYPAYGYGGGYAPVGYYGGDYGYGGGCYTVPRCAGRPTATAGCWWSVATKLRHA